MHDANVLLAAATSHPTLHHCALCTVHSAQCTMHLIICVLRDRVACEEIVSCDNSHLCHSTFALAIYVYMFMFTTCSRNICRLLKPPQLRFKYLRDNTINRAKCFIISRLSRQRKFIGKQFLFSRFTTHQCSVDNFYAAQKFTFLAAALYVRMRYCSYTLHTRV